MKRICLFAGYNYNNVMSQYVVDYLKELSRYADIYYLADGELPSSELQKIKPFVRNAWVENHHKYDFGSYALLATKHLGDEVLKKYDEVIFANDSCICINSFKPVFAKMDKSDCDFWGLLGTDEDNITDTRKLSYYLSHDLIGFPHFNIGSYFWAFRRKGLELLRESRVLNKIIELPSINRMYAYTHFEIGVLQFMQKKHAKIDAYFHSVFRYSTTYMNEAFMLARVKFPLLKVRIFVDNIGGATFTMEQAAGINDLCDYPPVPYIREIQKERKAKSKNCNAKRMSLREILRYVFPPCFHDFAHIVRDVLRKIRKIEIKRVLRYLLPPVLHDFAHSVRDFFRNIRKGCAGFARKISESVRLVRSGYLKDKRLRLCTKERPPYGGWYPCHIKNYERIQMQAVRQQLGDNPQNMVVFFNVMRDFISGGMLSIDRFIEHSGQIADSSVRVIESGIPLENAVTENPFFRFSRQPIAFDYIVRYSHPQKLLLNIPECFTPNFVKGMDGKYLRWLRSIPDVRINILNQSDALMPAQHWIEELRILCDNKLTITAAHVKYCTKEKAAQYNCPVYLLTPFLPEFYRVPKEDKQKIIVLSPDPNGYRSSVIDLLTRELPDYKQVVVSKMTLEEYKRLISKALFTITFGEGYDGYFLEPYLSNSISFSIRNKVFFPKDFKPVPTVYDSWDILLKNIVKDIKKYENNSDEYKRVSELVEREIRRFTNNDQSEKDLAELYKRFDEKTADSVSFP